MKRRAGGRARSVALREQTARNPHQIFQSDSHDQVKCAPSLPVQRCHIFPITAGCIKRILFAVCARSLARVAPRVSRHVCMYACRDTIAADDNSAGPRMRNRCNFDRCVLDPAPVLILSAPINSATRVLAHLVGGRIKNEKNHRHRVTRNHHGFIVIIHLCFQGAVLIPRKEVVEIGRREVDERADLPSCLRIPARRRVFPVEYNFKRDPFIRN